MESRRLAGTCWFRCPVLAEARRVSHGSQPLSATTLPSLPMVKAPHPKSHPVPPCSGAGMGLGISAPHQNEAKNCLYLLGIEKCLDLQAFLG